MKLPQFFIISMVFGAASFSAQAQLMHWSYSGTVRYTEPGEGWFAPGELVTDSGPEGLTLTPARVDITFDSQLTPSSLSTPENSIYFPATDPSGTGAAHTMRMRFGAVDLTIPVDEIQFDTVYGVIRFYNHSLGTDVGLVHSNLPTSGPGSPLPTTFPPFTWRIGFFWVTIPEGQAVSAGFFEADINEARVFSPVPEPTTVGLVAGVLLGGFVLVRFTGRARQIGAVSTCLNAASAAH